MHLSRKVLYSICCIFLFFFLHQSGFAQQQPIPDWVKDIGGNGESKLTGIAVDKSDNVYVSGNFQGTITVDHSGVSTGVNLTSKGDYDIFIAKYTSDGKLIWAKSIGGDGLDQVNSLSVDNDGNAIIGAQFNSSSIDCDPGAAAFNLVSSGGDDALVVKLDLSGNFLWARKIASNSTDRGHKVTTDQLGNVIFVGSYAATATAGSFTLNNQGGFDGFVAKYDPAGTIIWAFALTSIGVDEIKSVSTNSTNEIAIMGYTGGVMNLNPRGTASNFSGTGVTIYFIAKYGGDGLLLNSANKIASSGNLTVSSIAFGPTDDLFMTGVYSGQVSFSSMANSASLTAVGSNNLFITKYTNTWTTVWAQNITSNASNPYPYYIAADVDNNAYIGGFFDQTLTFTGSTTKTLTFHGGRDTFFAKYDGNGVYQWAFNFGSACTGNFGHKIAVDSKKNVLLGGAFCSTVDFNPGTCVLNLTAKHSNSDAYISKYNQIKFTGEPLITFFELAEQTSTAIIDVTNKKITVRVKAGTDLTKLKPAIRTDIGVLFPLSDTQTDLSTPKTYKISSNCADYNWVVEVTIENATALELCSGEEIKLIGNTTVVPNPVFVWQIKDANNNWITAPNIANLKDYEIKNFTNNGNADLAIEFRRKVTSNGVDAYDTSSSIIIHPVTTNNIISSLQTTFCTGTANVQLEGTLPQGAANVVTTYKWQQSSDNINWNDINGATGKNYAPPQFSTTTYFRRITLSATCTAFSNSLKIEVFPLVTTANAGVDLAICASANATLAANTPRNTETGSWSLISPLNYNPFNAQNINNPIAQLTNLPENTEIVLRWTIKQNSCSGESTDDVKIFNYGVPIASMPSAINLTAGQSIAIPITLNGASNVVYTYQWSPALKLDNAQKLSPNANPTSSTTYHLKISYGSNCSLEKDIKIVVNTPIVIEFCPEKNATLTGEINNDNQPAFQWQLLTAGNWVDLANEKQKDLQLTTPQNNTSSNIQISYRRRITLTNADYYDSNYQVIVYPKISNNIISSDQLSFCGSSNANGLIQGTLPIAALNASFTYVWEYSEDGLNWSKRNNDTDKDLIFSGISKTTSFRRTAISNTCNYTSNVVKIEINPAPTISNAGANIDFCSATNIRLNANAVAANEIGKWTVISPIGYDPFNAQTMHNPKALIEDLPINERIILEWTIENTVCNSTSSSQVTFSTYGDIKLSAPSKLVITLGQKVNLEATANLMSNVLYNIDWTPKKALDQYNILNPTASPTENTNYTLNINYGANCVKTVNVAVVVLKDIIIPNVFSPNGDEKNDTWLIKNIENYPDSKVDIFNRYGMKVYHSDSYLKPWDGKHNNSLLPVGVYYYMLYLNNKAQTFYKGSVTILR